MLSGIPNGRAESNVTSNGPTDLGLANDVLSGGMSDLSVVVFSSSVDDNDSQGNFKTSMTSAEVDRERAGGLRESGRVFIW